MSHSTNQTRTQSDTPRARFDALPPERQAQLLEPAEAEFAAHGFEGASLNKILAAAQMSKGQAYYYITDKGDLYRAVIERGLQRIAAAVGYSFAEPGSAPEFWQHFARLLRGITEVLLRDKTLAALARGIYHGSTSQAALAEPLSQIRAHADKLIVLGQSLGAVRTDLPQSFLADTLFATIREIDRWFAAHWSELDETEATRLNHKAAEMIAAMAAPPRSTPRNVDESS